MCAETFQDLFDGKLGKWIGEKANFKIIPGREKDLKVFPVAKVPYDIHEMVQVGCSTVVCLYLYILPLIHKTKMFMLF